MSAAAEILAEATSDTGGATSVLDLEAQMEAYYDAWIALMVIYGTAFIAFVVALGLNQKGTFFPGDAIMRGVSSMFIALLGAGTILTAVSGSGVVGGDFFPIFISGAAVGGVGFFGAFVSVLVKYLN